MSHLSPAAGRPVDFPGRLHWCRRTAVLGVVLAAALVGCGDDDAASTASTGTATETTTVATTTTAPPPTQTLEEAQQAVDANQYAQAVTIATALGAGEANAIRRRISNRIARRILTAVRAGNLGGAKRLLPQADDYPATSLTRQARSSYKTARSRAADRKREREQAAEQRRDQEAAEREQRRQEREQQQQPDDSLPSAPSAPSGGTCADTPQTDFPVPPGDPRDRDNDGIACES